MPGNAAADFALRDIRGTGRFAALALQCWSLVDATSVLESFIAATGLTFPVLARAFYLQLESPNGRGIPYDNDVLVDADGIVRYTSVDAAHTNPLGRYEDAALRQAIRDRRPVGVASRTWSAVKEMHR